MNMLKKYINFFITLLSFTYQVSPTSGDTTLTELVHIYENNIDIYHAKPTMQSLGIETLATAIATACSSKLLMPFIKKKVLVHCTPDTLQANGLSLKTEELDTIVITRLKRTQEIIKISFSSSVTSKTIEMTQTHMPITLKKVLSFISLIIKKSHGDKQIKYTFLEKNSKFTPFSRITIQGTSTFQDIALNFISPTPHAQSSFVYFKDDECILFARPRLLHLFIALGITFGFGTKLIHTMHDHFNVNPLISITENGIVININSNTTSSSLDLRTTSWRLVRQALNTPLFGFVNNKLVLPCVGKNEGRYTTIEKTTIPFDWDIFKSFIYYAVENAKPCDKNEKSFVVDTVLIGSWLAHKLNISTQIQIIRGFLPPIQPEIIEVDDDDEDSKEDPQDDDKDSKKDLQLVTTHPIIEFPSSEDD